MKRFFLTSVLAILGAFASSHPLAAQLPGGAGKGGATPPASPTPTPKPLNFPLWKAELPGGNYVIARNSINAVSSQQYILNGVARVTEVNISTAGVFQPRFYFIEPLSAEAPATVPGAQLATDRAQEAAKDAADSAAPGDPPWSKVMKDYPTTTHAGTIEFRLDTKEQLQQLFESVERTWLTGKSEVYTPDGVRPFDPNEELKNKDADADKSGEGGPGSGGESGSENN